MRKKTFKKRGKNRKRGGTKGTTSTKKNDSKKTSNLVLKFASKPESTKEIIVQKKHEDTFTIMTFNVESWLNVIRPVYNEDKTYNEVATSAIHNSFKEFLESPMTTTNENWTKIKKICSSVDILCVQEDALMGEGRLMNTEIYKIDNQPQTNFIENIGDLNLVSSCKSHPYRWPDTVGLYYSGSKLSNTIYSKYDAEINLSIPAQLSINKVNTINTEDKIHPRCWAVSQINVVEGKPPIKVATIHLSGGRFDDIASLEGNNYIIKIRQVIELIKREKPDIICGDLNTKYTEPECEDKYFLGLPCNGKTVRDCDDPTQRITDRRAFYNCIYDYILNKTPIPTPENSSEISRCDKWYIWMYGLDFVFKDEYLANLLGSFPYYSAENNDDTTIFGGIVDMIYYNPQRMDCIQSGAVQGVISPGKRILSDHAPVKAKFLLK